MDKELQKNLEEVLAQVRNWSMEDVEAAALDPLAKMMLVALLYETQKIKDSVDMLGSRIADHFCEDFIPRRFLSAIPAVTVLEPVFLAEKMTEGAVIDGNARFSYLPSPTAKPITYVPVFQNNALPFKEVYWLTSGRFHSPGMSRPVSMTKESPNVLWLGLNGCAEIECLKGLSLLFKGVHGLVPKRISVGDTGQEISFATMDRMEDIEMVEPFDAQQASGCSFAFLQVWKESFLDMKDLCLVYLTDPLQDRDLFKPKHFPSVFQFCLMSEEMDAIKDGTLWLKVEFPAGSRVPDDCSVVVNAFPVANVDVASVVLTASNPIAKLQCQDQEDAFFLEVLKPSNRSRRDGFDIEEDEYLVRDFDAECYHDGDLYRDVRYLYHHFVEDYHAFLEYNGIRDGELIRQLRENFNRIGKSVGSRNDSFRFNSGTYVMRNINHYPQPTSTKVSFLTTHGKVGNRPQAGDTMENLSHPAFDAKARVVIAAACGRDKASADERYELLRYYTLTQDRLYTKMDIEAFLRKEIMSEFGKTEFPRILIRIFVGGMEGPASLRRGLYIDIEFKDKKNYDKAVMDSFAPRMQQAVEDRSCLSMPVIVGLVNLEE
jgi:hypothetical protein